MAKGSTRRPAGSDTVEVAGWKVERRLATARVEGRGPQEVEDECQGHCCRHGVYASLLERDRVLAYADRIKALMDDTQTTDVDAWFEEDVEEDDDFPGGLCIGTATHNDKCAFLDRDGLCVLQRLEPGLELAPGERLKPFYCRLFPLTTWYGRVEFDDLCDGVRPCCTLASDGSSRCVDAYAFEFTQVLGEEGYREFQRLAERLQRDEAAAAKRSADGKRSGRAAGTKKPARASRS